MTELVLQSSNFSKACPSTPKGVQAAAAGRKRQSKKVVSRLWGNGKGRFRTRGRNSTATVRGTLWRTDERCDGTLTRVREGTVTVRDLRLGRNVIVRAPRAYLARVKRAAIKTTRRP